MSLNSLIETFLEGTNNDFSSLSSAFKQSERSEVESVEDAVLSFMKANQDKLAGARAIAIAPLLSLKFHQFGLKQARDHWKKVAGLASKELIDELGKSYEIDDSDS